MYWFWLYFHYAGIYYTSPLCYVRHHYFLEIYMNMLLVWFILSPFFSLFAACGHMCCFWCVYNSMSCLRESQCPVCRNQYYHFPTVCQLLHFLLLKIYTAAYKRRESQTLGMPLSLMTYAWAYWIYICNVSYTVSMIYFAMHWIQWCS